jgi:UDP:flavonoid glycosyltransferase YjiC (YdhE family)
MGERIKFLIVPMGSAGDVLPLVWLGRLLKERGHEVEVIAQVAVAKMPERAGLTTVVWGDAEEQEAIIRNPDIWHPRKALDIVIGFAGRWAGQCMEAIKGRVEEGRTVMISGALAFGARILRERWGVPLITMHVQPCVFMSVEATPVMMAGLEWLPRAPKWFRQGFFDLANWVVDWKMGRVIEDARVAAGLPRERIKGLMRHYWHSPDGVLCTFPEWFAPKEADWPKQAVLSRFPLYDENGVVEPEAAVEEFMAAGEAPVIITPGSANAHAQRFIREAVAACGRVKRRALVITRYTEQVGELPAGSASFKYVPFGQVFGRAAAVVHHGGIGTTSQCLAAGVPQLIMPLAHDQPDNAARAKALGVADYVYPKKFNAALVAERLEGLINMPAVQAACVAVREKMVGQMTKEEMGALVEGMSERALQRYAHVPV